MEILANNTFLSPSQIANIRDLLSTGNDEIDYLEGTPLQALLDELAEQRAAAADDATSNIGSFRSRDGSTPLLDLSTQVATQSILPSPQEATAFDSVVDFNQAQQAIFVELRMGSDLSTQNNNDDSRLAQAVVDLQTRNGGNLGLLGYDVNGNGAIDSEGELFGFDDGDPLTPELSGSTDLTVTGNVDGTALTFSNVTASDSDADGLAPTLSVSQITAPVTAVREEREITIGATVEIGDTFNIELSGSGPITFTATTTNSNDVATGLASAINAFYGSDASLINANSTGSVLTVQGDATGASFTLDSLSTTNAVAIAQQDTLDVFQVATNDSFTTTVNGFDFSIIAGVADTEDTVRDSLVAAINASTDVNSDVVAAPTGTAGEFTVTSLNAGTAFTVATSTIDGGGGTAQAVNASTTILNQVVGTEVVSRSWWKFAGGALRAGDCWPCQAARSRVAGWIG